MSDEEPPPAPPDDEDESERDREGEPREEEPPPPPPDDGDASERDREGEPRGGSALARLAGQRGVAEEDLATLTAMGFSQPQCELALAFARGSVEGALQILLNPEIMELFSAGLMGGRGGRALGGVSFSSKHTLYSATSRSPTWLQNPLNVLPAMCPLSDLRLLASGQVLAAAGGAPPPPGPPRPPPGAPRNVEVTEAAMAALMEMGYPPVRCSKSLFQTGGDVERAAMFMLEHGEEPDEWWIFSPDDLA